MYDRWSLDVLYSGFEDEKFQNDFKKLDELVEKQIAFAASLGEKDARTRGRQRHPFQLQGRRGDYPLRFRGR